LPVVWVGNVKARKSRNAVHFSERLRNSVESEGELQGGSTGVDSEERKISEVTSRMRGVIGSGRARRG
jgi:hypothetical protein